MLTLRLPAFAAAGWGVDGRLCCVVQADLETFLKVSEAWTLVRYEDRPVDEDSELVIVPIDKMELVDGGSYLAVGPTTTVRGMGA